MLKMQGKKTKTWTNKHEEKVMEIKNMQDKESDNTGKPLVFPGILLFIIERIEYYGLPSTHKKKVGFLMNQNDRVVFHCA